MAHQEIQLCVDCYSNLGDGKRLPKQEDWWVIVPSDDYEPHFSRGGPLSCDGCDTTLGGDRYDCFTFKFSN